MKKISGSYLPGIILLSILLAPIASTADKSPQPEYYQLTVYHYTTEAQKKLIDDYLQNAFLPALHRVKIAKVGVFNPLSNDTAIDKRIYVLVPFQSLDMVTKIPVLIRKDKLYQTAGSEYLDAVHSSPPYTRMETILMQAFSLAPKMKTPSLHSDKRQRVYELRSYEGPTEKLYKNKVKMFNEGGEIDLFERLGFNAVFYAEVLAGSRMPNLMYMTSFETLDERNSHWKTFSADPYWKKLSADPEYQHNVSHSDIILMYPADYSDI